MLVVCCFVWPWWRKTAPPLQHPALRGKDLVRQQRLYRAASQQQQQQPQNLDFDGTFHDLDHVDDEMAHTPFGFDPQFLRPPPANPHHPNPHYDIESLPQDQQAVIIQERAVQPWRDILQGNPHVSEQFAPDKLPEGLALAIKERDQALQSVEELRNLGENIEIGGQKTPCATAIRMSTTRTTRTSLAAGGETPARSPHGIQEVSPATPSMTKAQLMEIIDEHIKDRARLLKIIDNLQTNVGDLEAQVKLLSDSNNLKSKKNKEVLKKLKGHYVSLYFRTCKFIRNEKDAKTLATGMYDLMFPEKEANTTKEKQHKIVWINTYTPHMHPIVNARRSYIQSQCKLACFNYYKKHKTMPALDDILRCCKREINLEDGEDVELFEWYWSDIACKFSANAHFSCVPMIYSNFAIYSFRTAKVVGHDQWGTQSKYYSIMSEATIDPKSDKTLFTASTEAYIYIMVDNCFEKWQAMAEYYENEAKDWKATLPKKVTKKKKRELEAKKKKLAAKNKKKHASGGDSDDEEEDEDDATVDPNEMVAEDELTEEQKRIMEIDQLYKAKYSSADGGQCKWGSFSVEGRVEHKRIQELIKKERTENNYNYITIEKNFLEIFRKNHRIVGNTYVEQCKLRGKRKRNAGDGPKVADDVLGDNEEELDLDAE